MFLSRWLRQKKTAREACRSRQGRFRPTVHELEARLTPTVLFNPYFGVEATTLGSGAKLNSPPLEVIFWGHTYWNGTDWSKTTRASAPTIASAISTMLSSPVWRNLSQYEAGGTPYLANWWIDTDHADPRSVVTDTDLRNEVLNAINDANSPILPPSNFNGVRPMYMVITPFGTAVDETSISGGDIGAVVGYHYNWNTNTNYGTYNLVYGWTGQPFNIAALGGGLSNIDGLTSVFSHEVAEAMTDAEPFSGVSCNAGSALPGGGTGEIGDFEPEDYNEDLYRVDGVLVQALWDNVAQGFTVSDGNHQHVDLYPSYTHNADGSYTYTGSTLYVDGDQLGSDWADSISIDTSATGGVEVTLNGENFAFEAGVGITQIIVSPYGGQQNTVNVFNTETPVAIHSRSQDFVSVGNDTNGLQGINGTIDVTNSASRTWLTLDDLADWNGRTVSVYNNAIIGLSPQPIHYVADEVSAVYLYGGYGTNNWTVYSTASTSGFVTHILTGSNFLPATNVVHVLSIDGDLVIDGGSGRQAVYISSDYVNGGTLANLHGFVTVLNSNPAGTSYLYIDDSADTTAQTMDLYFGQFTSMGSPSAINWVPFDRSTGGVVSLQVRGGMGMNTYNVYSTGSGTASYTTELDTGPHGGWVNVYSTLGDLNINNQGDLDLVYLGSDGVGSDSVMDGIQGNVNVSGAGSTYLYLGDAGDYHSHIVDLYDGQLTGLCPATITWTPTSTASGGVTYFDVRGSSAGSVYNIHNTSALYFYTWLQTGIGNDIVNVLATQSGLYDYNLGGQDSTYIGATFGSANTGTGSTTHIGGFVYPEGAGFTSLYVDDSGDPTSRTATLTTTQLTGLGMGGPITWPASYVNALTVYGPAAAGTFNIQSTAAGTPVTLIGHNGIDTYNVGSSTTSSSTLSSIAGNLTINGGLGKDTVNVRDGGQSTAQTYTLSAGTFSGSDFAGVLSYTADKLVVTLGTGSDGVVVNGASVPPGVSINGGASGVNTLTGPNLTNAWTINGGNTGNLGGATKLTFSNFQNLVGGTANDTFTFSGASASLAGAVAGGGGSTNKLSFVSDPQSISAVLSTSTSGSVSFIAGGFSGIKSLAGSTASGVSNTLTGTNASTAWSITALNGGKAGTFAFTGIQNLVGGNGADTFKVSNGKGVSGSIVAGGNADPTSGNDLLDYSAWTVPVTVNLQTGTATGIGGTASGFHLLHGGSGNDSLTGSTGNDIIRGNAGDDVIQGNGGNDILIGGQGNDTLSVPAASGRSILIGSQGADHLSGGNAGNILIGGYTAYDTFSTTNQAALNAILTEWISGDAYATRISKLRSGLTASLFKLSSTTVHDDATTDALTGKLNSPGNPDWFWAGISTNPDTTNAELGEQLN